MPDVYTITTATLRGLYNARISTPPILEPVEAYFPDYRRFTEAEASIRQEALAQTLQRAPRFHELLAVQSSISANDGRDWRMFVLKAYGVDIEANLQACPVLASLLARSPQVLSAALSYLAPHKHIPPHRGPFKGIIRFHLMLSMPTDADGKPAARLFIEGREFLLRDGDCLLWDDTFRHEVRNDSEQPRLALLLDIRRPLMPLDMRLLSRVIIFGVQQAMKIKGVSFAA
ncbi:MAG: aspartyl/asparaginyl beta-hydroxylase domain-containing protein [Thermomicrobiales bacterium]